MLECVLERLDAGQPIISVATTATQFKSVFQLIPWLFFCLRLLWHSPSAMHEDHVGGEIMRTRGTVTIGRID